MKASEMRRCRLARPRCWWSTTSRRSARLLEHHLARAGYDVVEAANGREAIERQEHRQARRRPARSRSARSRRARAGPGCFAARPGAALIVVSARDADRAEGRGARSRRRRLRDQAVRHRGAARALRAALRHRLASEAERQVVKAAAGHDRPPRPPRPPRRRARSISPPRNSLPRRARQASRAASSPTTICSAPSGARRMSARPNICASPSAPFARSSRTSHPSRS